MANRLQGRSSAVETQSKMLVTPLTHEDRQDNDDESRARDARLHLAKTPSLQLVAELLGKLRSMELSWWTPAQCRERWSAIARMRWFKERPDLRQQITSKLTGLAPNAARRFWEDDQAALIDAVIDTGDIDVAAFENAFDPADMVVYGPQADFWREFRERMPWEEDSGDNQKIASWLLKALLADRSSIEGLTRRPILTALEVRSAIDPEIWARCMPLDIRVAVDEARLRAERARPREPFHSRHELSIATPERIVQAIPLTELMFVIAHAERAMGFDGTVVVATDPQTAQSIEPPRPSQIN